MFTYLLNLLKTWGLRRLAQQCGPAHYPCLYHSALNPYRPVIRIVGEHQSILEAFSASNVDLSREMQGDRFGKVSVNDTTINFGLVITRRENPEMFIEIAKYEPMDRTKELELLRMLFDHLTNQMRLQMELVEQ